MRSFFINSFEKLIAFIIILMSLGVILGAFGTMLSGQPGAFFGGLAVLVFGAIYVIFMGGVLYLALGIHDNTQRTAEAVERLASAR